MCQEAKTSLKRVLMSALTRIRWMKTADSQTKCLSSTSFGAKRVAWRYARSPKSTSSPSHHQKLQCHPFLIASSYYVDSHKLTQWDWKVHIPKSTTVLCYISRVKVTPTDSPEFKVSFDPRNWQDSAELSLHYKLTQSPSANISLQSSSSLKVSLKLNISSDHCSFQAVF